MTVAIEVALLNHVPPPAPACVSVIELPTHTVDGPDIVGIGPTTNVLLVEEAPTV